MAAASDEDGILGGGEVEVGLALFDVAGESEIKVVAAEDEMFADGDAVEAEGAVFGGLCLNEGEVGGAAADIANKDGFAGAGGLSVGVVLFVHPVVEGGLGFFDEKDTREACEGGGADGEFAGDFIEGGGHGDDHILLFHGVGGVFVVPGEAYVAEVAGADGGRRKAGDIVGGMPGKNIGGTVDATVAHPGFGGVDEACGGFGAVIACEEADEVGGGFILPGQAQGGGVEFAAGGFVVEGRERVARFNHGGCGKLGDEQIGDAIGIGEGIDKGGRGIGGAEVDADDIAGKMVGRVGHLVFRCFSNDWKGAEPPFLFFSNDWKGRPDPLSIRSSGWEGC